MTKYQDGVEQGRIDFAYTDSIVTKSTYNLDGLAEKNVYFMNEANYADSNIDSVFFKKTFYKTYYKYDEENFLIEETNVPGVFDGNIISEPSTYSYSIVNSNKVASYFIPKGITFFYRYDFSDLPLGYDIIEYNNSVLGLPNSNLPVSFGIQTKTAKYGHEGGYTSVYQYSYILNQNLVITKFDSRTIHDSVFIERYDYTYNFN